MKVLGYTMSAAGPLNALTGLCQSLQDRGHHITFVLESGFVGQATKYGFDEILLQSPPAKKNENKTTQAENPIKFLAEKCMKIGLMSNKNSREKFWAMLQDGELFGEMAQKCIEDEPQVKAAIERVKPDVIIMDNWVFVLPCILHGQVPWVNNWCSQPLALYNSKQLPPVNSGLPTFDKRYWTEFDEVVSQFHSLIEKLQNEILDKFGYPPIKINGPLLHSPYLNIYGYPKELDYQEIVPLPKNTVQIDAFNRRTPESYEFPDEFKAIIKPGDKLVYISMGSMGSINVDLMKRVTSALANTPHKYIVSKGPLGDEYELPGNMWGENYLPQVNILPLVDLVITHGGNNTTTETICAGKPMIVMPLFDDQFDNAQRVQETGFGIRIEPFDFEPSQLITAVDQLINDDATRCRVQQAAKRIAQSNSKERASIAIEQLVQKASK